jgi:hypothetical protein
LIAWLKKRIEKRRHIQREAERLISERGPDGAWQFIYGQSRDLNMNPEFRATAQQIRREIERRTGKTRQTDTATRYLFDDDK